MADSASTWVTIREGISDIERLIGQKQYNLAMVKSRQTLEVMVRTLADRHGIEYTELKETIDGLRKNRVITSATAEHYHKIRMIGNKAVHENDDTPTGANTAYHLLSQELTAFAGDFAPKTRGQWSRPASSSNDRRDTSSNSKGVQQVANRTSKRNNKTIETVFKIMIPIFVLILIAAVINFVIKKNKDAEDQTEIEVQVAVETIQETHAPETYAEPESVKEIETRYVITGDVVNVRSEPNTECEILGQLKQGDEVDYVADYDTEWAEVNYNDQQAYISRQYMQQERMQ